MEFDVNNLNHMVVCSDVEFDDSIDKLGIRGLISLVSKLQSEMCNEQRRFDELSERISGLIDTGSRDYKVTSAELCKSQARLAQLCARNMKCFTKQAKSATRQCQENDKTLMASTLPRNGFKENAFQFKNMNGHLSTSSPNLVFVQPEDSWTLPLNGIRKGENVGNDLKASRCKLDSQYHEPGSQTHLWKSTESLDQTQPFDGSLHRGKSLGDGLDCGRRAPSVEEILQSVKELRMRQQSNEKINSSRETNNYEQISEPVYQSVTDDEPIYENITDEPLYDVPRKWEPNGVIPTATQLILQLPNNNNNNNNISNSKKVNDDSEESECDKDSLEDGEGAPEIPSPDYGSDEDDEAYGVYEDRMLEEKYCYPEDQGLEVIVEEDEEDEDYVSRSENTLSPTQNNTNPQSSDDAEDEPANGEDAICVRKNSSVFDPPDSAVDVDDLSSLDGVTSNNSLIASPVDTPMTSWPEPSKKHQLDKTPITFSTPLHSFTQDSGMGESYFKEESKWECAGDRGNLYHTPHEEIMINRSTLPSVKALRSQFECNIAPKTLPRSGRNEERDGGNVNTQMRRSKSVVSEADKTIPELVRSLSYDRTNGTNGKNEVGQKKWGVRTAKPIFSPDPPPSADDVIPSIIAQFGSLEMCESDRSMTSPWDPTLLLNEMYRVQSPQPTHNVESCFINIEGYLDKLPSGRRKATFWNAWKRRFFRLKDGYLYYYQNQSSEKPSLTLNLMGGHVDSMETTMLGVDDGKGHYVVVRCSSKNEVEQWRTALKTHTVENFSLTYTQPVPAYPHFYEDVLLIDLGSSSVRAGILCNQPTLPQIFFPTVSSLHRESLARLYGIEALNPSIRASGSVTFPLRPSTKVTKFSVDLEAVTGLLNKVFKDLNVDPSKFQIQLSLPRNFSVRTQTEVLSLLFDHFRVRSVNLTSQTVLSLLSYNATSGIVVDVGERMDVVPIIDGYVVEPGVSRIPYGGSRVVDHLRHFLVQRHYNLVSAVDSFLVRYVLENICYCAEKYNEELQHFYTDPESFEASVSLSEFFEGEPPWEEISLENGRFQSTEALFNPDAWGLDHPGIHKLVHRAIQECSLDIRKEMTRCIYLSGGLTLLPGFSSRLEYEVDKLTPPSLSPKVHASPYRYHAAYLGACILASSPGFEEAKITVDDWNANGAQCIRKWHL